MEFLREEVDDQLAALAVGTKIEKLRAVARDIAQAEVADAVREALAGYSGTLRDLQRESGLDPSFVSKLANGHNMQGATVASLAQIALALGKSLHISIE
jgi:transcriptional regulator with XRE-family HTH domain